MYFLLSKLFETFLSYKHKVPEYCAKRLIFGGKTAADRE